VGNALYQEKRFVRASKLFEKAGAVEMMKRCYVALAKRAARAGNDGDAAEWYLRAGNRRLASDYYQRQARKLLKRGLLREAARLFKKANADREYRQVALRVAEDLERRGQLERSLSYYESSGIEMKPVYERFAARYLEIGRFARSIECFELAGITPKRYHQIIARELLESREFDKALSHFLKAGLSKRKSFALIAAKALQSGLMSVAETYFVYSGLSRTEAQVKIANRHEARGRLFRAGEYFLRAGQRQKAVDLFHRVLERGEGGESRAYALITLVELKDRKAIADLRKHARSDNERLAGAARFYWKVTRKKKLNVALVVYTPIGMRLVGKEKGKRGSIARLPALDLEDVLKRIPPLARSNKKYFKVRAKKKSFKGKVYNLKPSELVKKLKKSKRYDVIIERLTKLALASRKILANGIEEKAVSASAGNEGEERNRQKRGVGGSPYPRVTHTQIVEVHVPDLFVAKSFSTEIDYKGQPVVERKHPGRWKSRIEKRWKKKNDTLIGQLLYLFRDIFNISD
jgi:tetratricopeptide (TPR) repeat protein